MKSFFKHFANGNFLAVIVACLMIITAQYAISPVNVDSADCSIFNGDQSTCQNTSGCSYPGNAGNCSAFDSDEYSCANAVGCSQSFSNCSWNGSSCDGGGSCSSQADESACGSATYQSSCSGNYDNGVCVGTYDGEAPTLVSAIVNGTTLTLTYSEGLDSGSIPAPSDFGVNVDGSSVSINSVTIVATTTIITLASPVDVTASVTVDYSANSTPIQDGNGNDASNFTSQVVNNQTIDTSAPVLSTAVSNRSIITLTYDKDLNESSVPSASDYNVTVNGIANSVTSISVNQAVVTLTLSSSVGFGDVTEIDYTVGVNPVESAVGTDAISLNNQAATPDSSCYVISNSQGQENSLITGLRKYTFGGTVRGVVDIDPTSNTFNTYLSTSSISTSPVFQINVGTNLYVISPSNALVINIDPSVGTYNTIADITLPTGAIYASVVGTNIYVSNSTSNSVSVIDANPLNGTYNTIIRNITVGQNPISSSVLGNYLYVNNNSEPHSTSVIDVNPASPTYNTVIATIPTVQRSITSIPSGSNVYLNGYGGKVSTIDANPSSPTFNTIISSSTTSGLNYYSVTSDLKVYVVGPVNFVTVLDANPLSGTYNSIIANIDLGGSAERSLINGKKLYVISNNYRKIKVIDIDSASANYLTVIDTVNVPSTVYLTERGDKVYAESTYGTYVINTVDDSIMNLCSPSLKSITSTSSNGDYTNGQSVNVTANFNKTLGAGSKMRVTLNTGDIVDLTTISGSNLYGSYVVGAGDSVPDLNVVSISSNPLYTTVQDTSSPSNAESLFSVPSSPELTLENSANLGDFKNISINRSTDIQISAGTNPYQMTTVGDLLYVANQGSNNVSIIDTLNNTVTDTVSVGNQPYGLVYNSASKEIYVANLKGNSISVIDADPLSGTWKQVTHTIDSTHGNFKGIEPYYVASYGTDIYVTNNISSTVSVIDTSTHSVTTTIPVGISPRGIKAHSTNNKIYVANFGSNYGGGSQGTVSVINALTNTVSANINVGGGPRGVTIVGNEVYVANFNDNTVSVINTISNLVTHTISVGEGPRGIFSLGTKVYVENYKGGTISVIDTATHATTGTYKVGNTPAGMTSIGADIAISRYTDGLVSIFDTTQLDLKTVVTPDTTAPSITGIASSTTQTTATITWTTDEAATSTLNFGTTASYGTATSSQTATTSHAYTLTGLTAGTTYHFQVVSTDSSGNLATSSDQTFTTSAVPSTPSPTPTTSSSGGPTAGGGSSGSFYQTSQTTTVQGTQPNQTNSNLGVAIGGIQLQKQFFTTPQGTPFTFNRNLTLATTVATDAKRLQVLLNSIGFPVSPKGAGSPGKETSVFGPATRAALARFQKSVGISPAIGNFGPITRAYVNNLIKKAVGK